jgi:cytoskeletal protein CcmA (bactofilin family)/DNA-directed RNA polymerase subunit RPC12/RpoP
MASVGTRAMPSGKQDRVPVACPKCGHSQLEPRSAYSTICKKCHEHFRIEEAHPPAPKLQKPVIAQKQVRCFQCGTELEVPVAAASTMCKRCSSYVDLADYHITQTTSKNFRTYGRLVVEEKGYLLNTDSRVADAVIKGRFIGKLVADRTLEIHSSATIKGSLSGAGRLVVPAGNHFRWQEALRIGGAEIAGELVATLHSAGTVLLKSSARLFGDVQAANLVIESGAIFVGAVRVGRPA